MGLVLRACAGCELDAGRAASLTTAQLLTAGRQAGGRRHGVGARALGQGACSLAARQLGQHLADVKALPGAVLLPNAPAGSGSASGRATHRCTHTNKRVSFPCKKPAKPSGTLLLFPHVSTNLYAHRVECQGTWVPAPACRDHC